MSRTLPRVRELKQSGTAQGVTAPARRTLPRVRELKLKFLGFSTTSLCRRTLPRVRELKLTLDLCKRHLSDVAPVPGCVN